jgi:hypothetical protein
MTNVNINFCCNGKVEPPTLQGRQQEKTLAGKSNRKEAVRKKAISETNFSKQAQEITKRVQSTESVKEQALGEMQSTTKKLQSTAEKGLQVTVGLMQEVEEQHQLGRSIHCTKKDSFNPKSDKEKTFISSGIYNAIRCQKCQEQKEAANGIDEMTSSFVEKILPHFQLDPVLMSACLEIQPTLVDEDNVFHCIFGRADMYGTFQCLDGSRQREDLAAHLTSNDLQQNQKNQLLDVLFQFVMKIKDVENYPLSVKLCKEYLEHEQLEVKLREELNSPKNIKILKLLQQLKSQDSLAESSSMESEPLTMEDILVVCEPDLKNLLEEVNKEFPIEKRLLKSDIVQEYSKFIISPWQKLGLPELELTAITNSKKIYIYEEVEPDDEDSTRSLAWQHCQTLNSRGDTEHYLLLKEDGSFHRLALNKQAYNFEMQKLCQNLKNKKLLSELRPARMQDLTKLYILVKKIAEKWLSKTRASMKKRKTFSKL